MQQIKKPITSAYLLENLLLKKILVKNDWETIQFQFNQIYPLFFIEFIKNRIQLTTGEEQLLALEKLGLKNKTIANLLGVLPESIHKSRYRLKKKINSKQQSA